jgi:hypothetical protein
MPGKMKYRRKFRFVAVIRPYGNEHPTKIDNDEGVLKSTCRWVEEGADIAEMKLTQVAFFFWRPSLFIKQMTTV